MKVTPLFVVVSFMLFCPYQSKAQNKKIHAAYVNFPAKYWSFQNPFEIGLDFNKNEEKRSNAFFGLTGYSLNNSRLGYWNEKQQTFIVNQIILGIDSGESIPFEQYNNDVKGIGIKYGKRYFREVWNIDFMYAWYVSASYNNLKYQIAEGEVTYTDSTGVAGTTIDSYTLMYHFTDLSQTRHHGATLGTGFELGPVFTMGENWMLIPKLMGGFTFYDWNQLYGSPEDLQSFSLDLTLSGSLSFAYKF